MPQVSILIPAYRAQPTIARAIASLKAQTMPDWEALIIADDGFDYRSFLNDPDPRLTFVSTNGIRTGVSHARNIGLSAAIAPVIAMLDADDLFYPQKLARMLPFTVEYGACVCALRYMDYQAGPCELGVQGLRSASGPLTPTAYMQTHYAPNAMLLFDRRRIPTLWREDLKVMEDLLFSIALYNHIPTIYHVNEILHEYVFTPGSLSTAAGAEKHFIASKRRILSELDTGQAGIENTEAARALHHFVEISLDTEQLYARLKREGSTTSFTELLNQRLNQSSSPETSV